ncbi:uncharacterized protein [Hyperolius riggenbachi]|uniref:uncharacterized protein n=1 Tax=Hyperolius riggenbachi TaxID=752182 RepID=UPI0035A384C5
MHRVQRLDHVSGDIMDHVAILLVIGGVSLVAVVQHPPHLQLLAGYTAQMSCAIRTPGWTQITHNYWKVNGSKSLVVNASRISITPRSLFISSVTPRDNGDYVCAFLDSTLESHYGSGTRLLVTAPPMITLKEDPGNHLLVCQAKSFFPPELDIYWRTNLTGLQIWENLMENEDGTFTKMSMLTIAEHPRGQNVTCHLRHALCNTTLFLYLSGTDVKASLYHQLFPVRVLLLPVLITVLASLMVWNHLHYKASLSFLCSYMLV